MKLTCFEYSVIESILKKHAPQLLHWLSDLEMGIQGTYNSRLLCQSRYKQAE